MTALLHLKVKICSLAAEATIIRRLANKRLRVISLPDKLNTHTGQLEPRAKVVGRDDSARMSLTAHRTGPVRFHAHTAQLAYGYLRGWDYKAVENKSVVPFQSPKGIYLWKAVQKDIATFGDGVTVQMDDLHAWYNGTAKYAVPERAKAA